MQRAIPGWSSCIGQESDCDDENPCTDDTCDPTIGCVHTPNTEACDDGNVCTDADICDGAGECTGTPVICDDENPCTDDTCISDLIDSPGCVYTELSGDLCDDAVRFAPRTICVCSVSARALSSRDASPPYAGMRRVPCSRIALPAPRTAGSAVEMALASRKNLFELRG